MIHTDIFREKRLQNLGPWRQLLVGWNSIMSEMSSCFSNNLSSAFSRTLKSMAKAQASVYGP